MPESLHDRWRDSGAASVFESRVGAPSTETLISDTNNNVWKVSSGGQDFVVKEITDPTVDVESEKRLLGLIDNSDRFRPIIHYERMEEAQTYIAIYPFIEGQSLDTVDFRNAPKGEVEKWAEQLHESFELIRTAETVEGFGRRSVDKKPNYSTWMDFVFWYIGNQANKGPRMAALRYDALRNAFERYAGSIQQDVSTPSLVCGDVNLRNYLITPENDLVCIHSPMLWHGDPAVPYGDAAVHLDSSLLGELFLERGGYPAYRIHLYAAFSAFAILVYIERFNETPLEQALCWGGVRPLLDIFDDHLGQLE